MTIKKPAEAGNEDAQSPLWRRKGQMLILLAERGLNAVNGPPRDIKYRFCRQTRA